MVDEILDAAPIDVDIVNATLDVDVKNATLEVNIANEPIDVNVGSWDGEAYSKKYTTTSSVQRFAATEKRFKSFWIKAVTTAAGGVYAYIGSYRATQNAFCSDAIHLAATDIIEFSDIDIYTLCYAYASWDDAMALTTVGILE